MRIHPRVAAIASLAVALVALLPAAALAADAATVSGTVTRDGTPVQGAEVHVLVQGNDMVWHATTDASGAWSVAADIAVGQKLQISATSAMTQSSPDKDGCVSYTAASGTAEAMVDVIPVAPLAISLDHPIVSRVCSATATPGVGPTPPATDAPRDGTSGGWATAFLAAALAVGVLLALAPFARPSRRP